MRSFSYLIFILTTFCFGQNKQLLYGFSNIPQALLQNPGGKVKNDWYFGIPALSHIHANVGSSGVSAFDLFADDGVDFNDKIETHILSLSANDFFAANQQLEIFSGGFSFGDRFNKNKYLSFGLYQESDFIAYYPKDIVDFLYEGNANNINREFSLTDLSASAEIISVWHVGFNKKVNENFSYGVRGKIYSSLVNVNSTNNRGAIVTRTGRDNFLDHVINIDVELRTSGINSFVENDSIQGTDVIKDLRKRVLFGGNLGLGFDIGFTKKINKQWTVDGSLLDVGFITHKKDVERYRVSGVFQFDGIPESTITNFGQGRNADVVFSEIEEELEDVFEVDTIRSSYTTFRPVKLNASINYAFGEKYEDSCNCTENKSDYLNAVGLQLYAISRPKQPQLALTAYYYHTLFKGLQAKATYTVDSFSLTNIGLGVSANLGPLNFYILADNLLEYQNIYDARSASLQLGFNYIFNKNEK